MILLISLMFSLLFYNLFHSAIKKYPGVFYLASTGFSLFIVYFYATKMFEVVPPWVTSYIIGPFQRGAFATATFIIVMMLGAINRGGSLSKKLYSIRGEMSIIASIFTFVHNIVFGQIFFVTLFTNPSSMSSDKIIATVISIIMLILLVPLFLTSFITVRKKMKAKTWKNVQKLAYLFFGLIYLHVMLLFLSNAEKHTLNMIIYSIIFAFYAVLRVKKAAVNSSRKLSLAK